MKYIQWEKSCDCVSALWKAKKKQEKTEKIMICTRKYSKGKKPWKLGENTFFFYVMHKYFRYNEK